MGKLGLGEWGNGGAPKENFLKEVFLWTPFKNFQKDMFNHLDESSIRRVR
jgi:hypothetical protein